MPREVLQTRQERLAGEPHCEHELVLETNHYNDILKSVNIHYGSLGSSLPEETDKVRQKETIIFLLENELSGSVFDQDKVIFVKPMPCVSRKYRVVGTGLSSASISTAFTKLSKDKCRYLEEAVTKPYIGQSVTSSSVAEKIKIAEHRTLYRDQALPQAEPLPLGVVEAYSETFELLWEHDLLEEIYAKKIKLDSPVDLKSLMVRYGYKNLKGDMSWWRPSSRALYSVKLIDELPAARKSFYTPITLQDPFSNRTTMEMDDFFLMPTRSVDSAGNITEVENDYRCLSPSCIVDPNRNRSFYMHDAFGRVIAVARSGKQTEDIADHLEASNPVLNQSQVEDFFESPTQEAASTFIRGAGSYRYYRNFTVGNSEAGGSSRPVAFADIGRKTHVSDGGVQSDLTIAITYLDGNAKELQTATLGKTTGHTADWRISEWVVRNNKGDPVRKFQPSISSSHRFVHACNTQSSAITTLYDPLARVVGTIFSDHSFSKVKLSTWDTITYDQGDTVLIDDPAEDADIGAYLKVDKLLSQNGSHENLVKRIIYGEHDQDPEILNSRGQVIRVHDETGIRKKNAFDYKGNCIELAV